MGCVNTKKQTKDEGKEEKPADAAPERNGAVDKSGEDGAKAADVQVAVAADAHKPTGTGDADLDAWREEALKIHNRQRVLHGVEPLTLNADLNASAQKWAENIAKLNMLKHTPANERELNGEKFGENLAHKNFGSSDKAAVDKFDPSAEDIVMMWYNESKDPGYDFNKKDMQSGTGHFTQVVWKASKSLGIGRVRVQDGNTASVFVCGQYIPPGNFNNLYSENVLPPKS